jgi:hypothetical protein
MREGDAAEVCRRREVVQAKQAMASLSAKNLQRRQQELLEERVSFFV